MNDDDHMPRAVEAVADLPKELEPSAGLEDRVVGALKVRGILGQRRRNVIEVTHWRLAGVAAAGLVLIMGGFALGLLISARTSPGGSIEDPTDGFVLAASVQGTGGEYLTALESLTDYSNALAEDEVIQGREVAVATLISATSAVTQLVPKDDVLRQLLQVILQPDAAGTPVTSELRTVRF
jgi:hypothetical protein